jgi:hypothetical protein
LVSATSKKRDHATVRARHLEALLRKVVHAVLSKGGQAAAERVLSRALRNTRTGLVAIEVMGMILGELPTSTITVLVQQPRPLGRRLSRR